MEVLRTIVLQDLAKEMPYLDLKDVPIVLEPKNMYDFVVTMAFIGWLSFISLVIWHLKSQNK